MTPYGTLVKRVEVKLANGTLQTVGVQSPLAMLNYQTLNLDHYSYMVRSALAHDTAQASLGTSSCIKNGLTPVMG